MLYDRVCKRCGMPVLHDSVTGQGRGRPKVAEPYSIFSGHPSRLRCEGELPEVVKDDGQADIIIQSTPGHMPRGRHLGHPEHPAAHGDTLPLRDEIHPVRISIKLEEAAVID